MEKQIQINNLKTPFWIDTQGRLRNENTNHWLKGAINKGYHFYNVYFKGKQYTLYTHRLVAEYFLENPNHYNLVHHKDGNKLNNNLFNLEWIDSTQHSAIHGQAYIREKIKINEQEIDLSQLKQFRNSPYWASASGHIYNLDKKIELRQEVSGEYKRVQCNYNLNGKHFLVHRLIWECFNGLIPKNMDINHIDGNPINNNLNNLELTSHKINCQKAKHSAKKIKAIHSATGEILHFSSLNQAAVTVFGSRGSQGTIKDAIKKHIIKKDYYWYYEE